MFDGFGRFLKGLPGQVMGGPMSQVPQQPGMPPMGGGVPPMGGMAPPRRGGGWRQNLDIIGSGLREMSGETGQLAGAQKRIAGAGQAEQQAQFRANLPVDQQAVFDVSPELWAQYFGKPKEAERPQRFETPGGIVEFGPNGPSMAYTYPDVPKPEKPRARERGPDGIYEQQDDGTWRKVATFGAAPRTFAPPRVGGGRAPANTTGKSSGGKPWERY